MPGRLNLRCGSDIKDALEIAGVSGDFSSVGDPICEGPCPGSFPRQQYQAARAAFMQAHWNIDSSEVLRRLDRDEQRLQQLENYDELLLWFEHDLFDQCILIQVLANLPAQALCKTSLICINAFPGVERFIGLGQLRPEQLKSLLDHATRVGPEHQHAAQLALRAWLASDPEELLQLSKPGSCGPLRFLPAAVLRHLQELPSQTNGLGMTDQIILNAINDGANSALEVFQFYQAKDKAPYLGDLMFWAHIYDLAALPVPLIELAGEFPTETLSFTNMGRKVFAETQNYMQLIRASPSSLYRWRGGIEQRPENGWYYGWDLTRSTITKVPFS